MIEPTEAEKYLPLVARLISGDLNLPEVKESYDFPSVKGAVSAASFGSGQSTQSGVTAIIPIMGPILKKTAMCGPAGLDYYSRLLSDAESNPKVNSILFLIDSGGGQAAGVQTFVEQMKSASKPTLALIDDGIGASAAYWIASGANQGIWAAKSTSIIGSIGTMITLADMRPAMEKAGIKVHDIYASKSTKKNRTFHDAIDGKYKPITEQLLDPFNEVFHNAVKESRGDKIKDEDVFTGATYLAEQALENGLIDHIGNIQEAVNHLQSIAKGDSENTSNLNSNHNTNSMKFKSVFTALLAAIGFASVKSEDEAPLVTEERLEALNAVLQSANETIAGHEQMIVEHEATIAQLKTDLKAEQDARAAAEADRDRYAKQAGSAHTPPHKDKPEGGNAEPSQEEAIAAEIAALPHNRALDDNPLFN